MADLSYIDLGSYCELPDAHIAGAGSAFVNTQISLCRATIYDQLRRQYDIGAMVTTEPLIVKKWIATMVAPSIYVKRGVDPTDLQFQEYVRKATNAEKAVADAANAEKGLYDLPMLDGSAAPKRIKVLSKSQADPGAWKREQADRAHVERYRARTYRY